MSEKVTERFKKQEEKIDKFLHALKVEMTKQKIRQRDIAQTLNMDETVLSQRFNNRKFSWHLAEVFEVCSFLNINPGLLFPGGTEYVLGSMSMLELFNMLISKNAKKIVLEQMRLLAPEE